MKIWTSEHVFEHPWETVVRAAWRKYPNPHNPAVVGIDVVDRHIDNKGVLRSHRLLNTKWGFPDWASKIIGVGGLCFVSEFSCVEVPNNVMSIKSRNLIGSDNNGFGSEHSEVDPARQRMTLKTRNLTFCSVITIDEQLVYAPHPDDKTKTQLKQEAVVTVHGVPLSSYMEKFVTDSISQNASKGRQAMEYVINKIKTETAAIENVIQSSTQTASS